MKWRTPDPGEEREGWAFAFFPIECEEGVTVWLQRYWRVERYESIMVHTGLRIWGWVWQRGYAYRGLTDQAQAMASEGREARRVYKPPPTLDDEPGFRVVLPCLACGAGVHVRMSEVKNCGPIECLDVEEKRKSSSAAVCSNCGVELQVGLSTWRYR